MGALCPGLAEKNKAAFKALEAQKATIEVDVGAELDWQELPEREGCRIRHLVDGGYKSAPEQWPVIFANHADDMVRLDRVLRSRIAKLDL
jgi:hypothetical protein